MKKSEVASLDVVLILKKGQMIVLGEFALTEQGSILINTSRGQVVNEKALVEA